MSKLKVFVEGRDKPVCNMFENRGFDVVNSLAESHFAVLTGGPDVDPEMYGADKHPKTSFIKKRDESTLDIYNTVNKRAVFKPLVGICRGAQFINVKMGGLLYQHVNNHALGGSKTHEMYDVLGNQIIMVTSTHHQMMIPNEGDDCLILGVSSEASVRELEKSKEKDDLAHDKPDTEAVVYRGPSVKTNYLCFQPHPEYVDRDHPCQQLFFDYLDEFILGEL